MAPFWLRILGAINFRAYVWVANRRDVRRIYAREPRLNHDDRMLLKLDRAIAYVEKRKRWAEEGK